MDFKVQKFVEALRSANANEREEAARRLGQLGDRDAIPALIEALSDTAMSVTVASMESLAKIGEPAVDPLLAKLDHPDSSLRYAVVEVLGDIGDARAADGLMMRLDDPQDDVQAGAADALERIGTGEALAAARRWRESHA
jgi:HEAT repeat protein